MNAWLTRKRKVPLVCREDGVVSLEFVFLFPVIALIVLAILEFGHLWIVRHTLTIATREGARAAVVFIPGTDAERTVEAKQVAQDTVNNYLQNTAQWTPGDWSVDEPQVTSTGATLVGGTLTVRARANEPLLILHKFIKPPSVVAETTMRFE